VPDGSSFAWQHWSHTFHYALVAGDGDWRRAGFVTAGQAFNHDLHARVAGAHDGDLPPSASMFHVEPKEVLLTALKPRGNPLASSLPGDVDPAAAGLALRCFESTGRPAQARVRSFTGLTDGRATDLLEQRERGAVAVEDGALTFPIGAADTLTVTALPATPPPPRAAADPSGPRAEPAQPVFTRYWLHNKGPAPIGNVPVSVHISPTAPVLPKAETAVALRVTVASSTRATAGRVELLVPTELAVEPASELAYDLAPGAHAGFDLTVRARPGVPSGRYFLAAQIGDDLGQTLEDVAAITVGEAGPEREEPLAVALETSALDLAPGERAEVLVRLENRARSEIRGEAQLVSPYGSWELLAPWTQGFAVRPETAHTLRYTVQAPATARPGSHWWALVKVTYFGRLAYTEAVPITITTG
jgi:hypothetical protein